MIKVGNEDSRCSEMKRYWISASRDCLNLENLGSCFYSFIVNTIFVNDPSVRKGMLGLIEYVGFIEAQNL